MPSQYGPEFDKWVQRIREELIPKIKESDVFISITPSSPEEVDVKFAVELGLAIMMDKPIIATCKPGTKIPAKLAAVVDRFVEMDCDNMPESSQRLKEVIKDLMREQEEE